FIQYFAYLASSTLLTCTMFLQCLLLRTSCMCLIISVPHPPSLAFSRGFPRKTIPTEDQASDRPARFGVNPGFAAGFCQFAHAHDVALPLRHRDHAACIQQVEDVARLDALVIGRQRHQMFFLVASVFPSSREV